MGGGATRGSSRMRISCGTHSRGACQRASWARSRQPPLLSAVGAAGLHGSPGLAGDYRISWSTCTLPPMLIARPVGVRTLAFAQARHRFRSVEVPVSPGSSGIMLVKKTRGCPGSQPARCYLRRFFKKMPVVDAYPGVYGCWPRSLPAVGTAPTPAKSALPLQMGYFKPRK